MSMPDYCPTISFPDTQPVGRGTRPTLQAVLSENAAEGTTRIDAQAQVGAGRRRGDNPRLLSVFAALLLLPAFLHQSA